GGRLDLRLAPDRVAAEPVDPAHDERSGLPHDPDEVGIRLAEPASMRAPAQDGGRPIQPGISHEEFAVPVRAAEELALAELGEVRIQRGMEVRATDELDAGAMR